MNQLMNDIIDDDTTFGAFIDIREIFDNENGVDSNGFDEAWAPFTKAAADQ